jgi:hypothetical protein
MNQAAERKQEADKVRASIERIRQSNSDPTMANVIDAVAHLSDSSLLRLSTIMKNA